MMHSILPSFIPYLQQQSNPVLLQSAVHEKAYEWQLLDLGQWKPIDNDHVIEANYCQPGVRGININFGNGRVFIDFEKLQTQTPGLQVKRLMFQPCHEEFGWYYKDDHRWREYGSPSPGSGFSVNGVSLESAFNQNRQGSVSFTVGSTGYTLDFSTMTQTNCSTGHCRKVRRRPKFTSYEASRLSALVSSTQSTGGGFKWEFMENGGQWTEYTAHGGSYDSAAIESQYQLNPQGQLHFQIRKYSYTLDFPGMYQVNNTLGTRRAVRRTPDFRAQQNTRFPIDSLAPTVLCSAYRSILEVTVWQFQDIDGIWKDYSEVSSVSNEDIEENYQMNPLGSMVFTNDLFSYELNFSAMTQTNLTTNTTRLMRRCAICAPLAQP